MASTCWVSAPRSVCNLMPRWAKIAVASLAVLAVLIGIAEFALRTIVPDKVATALRDALELPEEHPVDVEMHGLALGYALGGNIGNTDVFVADAPVTDDATATLRFHADLVPFNVTSREMRGATASVYVSATQLPPVISLLTNGVADSGRTSDGDLAVGRTIQAFGFTVPIEATLDLSVVDGGIVRIEPTGLSAVGFDLDAAQLNGATGGLLEPLLSAHELCVSDQLPRGVTLTDISVTKRGVMVNAKLADDFLSSPAQQELGSCG